MRFKAYLLLGVSLLLLIAATVLIVMNLGDYWSLHVYFKQVTLSGGLWLLLSALSGALLLAIIRAALPAGLRAWKSANVKQRNEQAMHRLEELERKQTSRPEGTEQPGE